LLYEAWDNGNTVLRAFQPLHITHIILPNGEVENTSLLLQNQMPINEILNGFSWAIIVTNQGTWYNITPIQLPGIIWNDAVPSKIAGIPWDTSALNTNLNPKWEALQGIKKLNMTLDPLVGEISMCVPDPYYIASGMIVYNIQTHPLSSPINVDNVGYNEGLTNKEVVIYLNSSKEWLNITYYSPLYYIYNVPNPYAVYWQWPNGLQGVASYGNGLTEEEFFSDPKYFPYFFQILTTNPYAEYFMPYIWNVGNYYNAIGHSWAGAWSKNVSNPGAIKFNYTYINATIGIYLPTNSTSNVPQYLYIYFNDFEITNLSALVPQKAIADTDTSNGQEGFFENSAWQELQYSWFDAPLVSSPENVKITQAYSQNPPQTFTVYEYNYAPTYEAFPVYPDYSGFPSYFGAYSIPAYDFSATQSIGYTGVVPYSTFYPGYNYFTLPNIPPLVVNDYQYLSNSQLIYGHYVPVQVYKLAINLYDEEILNYGYNPDTSSWILLYQGTLYYSYPFYMNAPVYITVPQLTYLLAISVG